MSLAKLYIKQSIKPLHGSFKLFNFASDTVRKRLDRFILKHGLKRITPHGFRHTHASLLFEAGIPAKIAQERLGHAKIAITMDLYTHLSKNQRIMLLTNWPNSSLFNTNVVGNVVSLFLDFKKP